MQEEASEDDEVDSDFDVDESTWNQEEDGEQQLQLMEQKKKKKQWLKPTKPKVTCHGTWEEGGGGWRRLGVKRGMRSPLETILSPGILYYRKVTFFCESLIYANYASQAAVA